MSKKKVFYFFNIINVMEFKLTKHFNDDDSNKMSAVWYAHKVYILIAPQYSTYTTIPP